MQTSNFATTQELFDKANLKQKPKLLQVATDTKLLCTKHRRYYDQELVKSLFNDDWLKCIGCPTCYQEQRAAEATRHVEKLNGNKSIYDIVNSKNADYRDETNTLSKTRNARK